ncbi:peptidoglycan-binding protein [Pueribacillus sp. YX66]|uniref:C40 family peptidase n=1 Tax=Pueribacillus sp. YX66 TaxID=3229242 RepID=UPI00358D3C91
MKKANKANKLAGKIVISSAFAAGALFSAPALGEAALGDQTLTEGMSHSDVKELQDVLKGKGYFTYHTSTGYFGSITKDALIQFQRDNNLPATGVADAATVRALKTQQVKASTSSNTNGKLNVNQTLRNGSRGSQVTLLQNKLKAAGHFTSAVDGVYGPLTAQAVRAYQKANGLLVDGIAGKQTLTALNNVSGSGSSAPKSNKENASSNTNGKLNVNQTLRNGSRGSQVTLLQNKLKAAGHFKSTVDGIYGPLTAQAVRTYQKANGLLVDGIAGKQTLTALNNVSGSGSSAPSKPAPKPEKENSSSNVLRLESRGQAVTKLQNDLKRLGFFGANSTGYYGTITEQAVREFQRKYRLSVDGIAGPATLSKVSEVLSGKDQSSSNGSSFNVMNVVADASEFIGVPYVWGGNSPSQGFDCSGFVVYVYNKSNVQIPRTVAQMWNTFKSVSKPEVGDLVFFDTTGGPSHVGIYIGNNKMIQAGTSTGVTISDMSSSYWSSRYIGAKRPY